jgi:BirA family biotin operon repressor/biotin-[acetyl-CoA-carboxylase] ligase
MTNTLFIGKVYHTFDELASTNDYAREVLAKSTPPEGIAIRAVSQSAGRGQYGSRWSSEAGKNLTISIILYPRWLTASAQFQLNEAVALALHDTIAALQPAASNKSALRVKWPNDIWMGPRKIAGILIQNSLKGYQLEHSIVGIGLNVNQITFPVELSNASSLALEWGQNFDLDQLANTLFECLERRYLQLKSGQNQTLQADYLQQLLGRGEERFFVKPDGSQFIGVIQGVAEDGRLIIQTGQGDERFEVKEVAFVS